MAQPSYTQAWRGGGWAMIHWCRQPSRPDALGTQDTVPEDRASITWSGMGSWDKTQDALTSRGQVINGWVLLKTSASAPPISSPRRLPHLPFFLRSTASLDSASNRLCDPSIHSATHPPSPSISAHLRPSPSSTSATHNTHVYPKPRPISVQAPSLKRQHAMLPRQLPRQEG